MLSGKDKSSAFAICNSSLYKKALSKDFLRKKFDAAYATEAGFDSRARELAEESHLYNNSPRIGEVKSKFDGTVATAEDALSGEELKKYKALKRLKDRYGKKTSRLGDLIDKKEQMNRNLKEYGKRKVSSSEKIATKARGLLSKVKKGIGGLVGAEGKNLVPSLVKAVR
jgi:hypothetical protein